MTRWQKPFHHIPVDDYLNDIDTKISMGYRPSHVHRLNNGIGPHERRYMNLMLAGVKPITLLDMVEFNLPVWQKAVEENGWGYLIVMSHGHCGRPLLDAVVYLPGQQWRAERLAKELRKRHRNTTLKDVRMGFLLGYTKECIAYFLDRCREIDYNGNTTLPVNIPEHFVYGVDYGPRKKIKAASIT